MRSKLRPGGQQAYYRNDELVDTDTVEMVNTSFIDEDLKEHLSDLLYRVKLVHQEGDVLIYILLEHKSRPDK